MRTDIVEATVMLVCAAAGLVLSIERAHIQWLRTAASESFGCSQLRVVKLPRASVCCLLQFVVRICT